MSNWFEENPTKSIISYTLVVIAATWAASYFVIDENKINLYKSQVDNEKSVNRQLQAKVSVLEGKILDLSNENKQLKEWLSSEATSYPALVNKIQALEKKLSERPLNAAGSTKNAHDSSNQKELYSYSENFVMGQSFTDPLTNATIGVSQIASDYTADIYLFLPGKESLEKKGVKPGSSWVYEFEKKQYKLTLNKIEWIGSSLKATVVEM
ncbi:hypothetical protein CKO50_11570 [Pseudoalteromonas sp. HM-SA03]|uniref:hypothetical protein n=1 Tax=Pseudoalteromonas sp. HM-SA03 TaxID=2029678 RepID=UPI000BADE537|nr:hypothetical protein [Pseudoalteromonas sp. HM-SA03]PAY01142.1 hypothetical protein CKO50_11570 [Pseudoalteromonas sp. HM-SA03]